jgi:RNA polymerase sigma-70 factor, ECF subfamily
MNSRLSLAGTDSPSDPTVPGHADDRNLTGQIAACLSGDQKAWEYLVEASHSLVYLICFEFTGSHSEAEDLTQDVFMKVYCNLHRYDPEKGTFRNWLRNVTRNYLVDRYRRTRLVRLSSSLDELISGPNSGLLIANLLTDTRPSQEDHLIALETHNHVHRALELLSPAARDTVRLCLIDERTHKDAADLLGVAEGTIKSRLSRARAELAQLLNPLQLAQL